MKHGPFGPIYGQYSRQGQQAVNFLRRKKEGEVPNALYHPKLKWIDLVWGKAGTMHSDGYGLSKIVKYHPEVVGKLASILRTLRVTQSSPNRYKLENDKYQAVISLNFFGAEKYWLLTMFEKKKKPAAG